MTISMNYICSILGTMMGITDTVGNIPGFLSPEVVGWLTTAHVRDRSMEMCPGGPDSYFSLGKKSLDPPKLQGKNLRTPPKLQGKNQRTPPPNCWGKS